MAEESDSAEISINYETLYEMLRKEKGREELQEIHPSFYTNLVSYLNDKIGLVDSNRNKHDLFSTAETSDIQTQIMNIRRMIRELFERREKKIIIMALNKSRTNSDIIDTSNLMGEERAFYEDVRGAMDRFRKGVLEMLITGRNPAVESKIPVEKEIEGPIVEPSNEDGTTMVRFLKSVPKFVDKELRVHGPFQEDDMANLPLDIAKVLILKGRAEEMQG